VLHLCRANAAVEGRLANYPNAFSIILPGIQNVGFLARAAAEGENDTLNKRFGRWSGSPEGNKGSQFVLDGWLIVLSCVLLDCGWSSQTFTGQPRRSLYP
jgi:hypothetical protein